MRPKYRTSANQAISLGVPVLLFGISFGALAVDAGMSGAQACVMSLTVFAGGAQLVAASVLATGGAALAAALAALALNTRYLGLGFAVSPRLRGRRTRRAVAAHLLIDESAALALADPEGGESAFWISGAVLFVAWNLGTAVGVVSGELADVETLGLDAAIPAALFAVLMPMLSDRRARIAAVGGALLALVSAPLVPPGVPFLIAAGGAIAALAIREGSRP